jgi:dolichol-phosphate mannosyltransferase
MRPLDLSVVIPARDEGDNLARLLPEIREVLDSLVVRSEILVVTSPGDELTTRAAEKAGATVLEQVEPGYGGALRLGFQNARGRFVLTMDADYSHPPKFIADLWRARDEAEIIIGSRYVPGGRAEMPRTRLVLSRILNAFFRRGLSLRVRDLSSGFRLYHAAVTSQQEYQGRNFDVLQQILVRAYAEGWTIKEVPFAYAPRAEGSSHAQLIAFGWSYLRTFWALWKLRNSILAADYDDRAYDSPIWLQRYWQRQRFRHVTELVAGHGPVLDVGCGSSRIIGALPPGSLAIDVLLRKVRHARKFGRFVAQASGFSIPVRDEAFSCVLCSQVIEHVPKDSPILDELCRVLQPGGRLVLGTPDYSKWQWVWIEKAYGFAAPGGYADEHIAHYTFAGLVEHFTKRGFALEDTRYIMQGELILAFRKPARA